MYKILERSEIYRVQQNSATDTYDYAFVEANTRWSRKTYATLTDAIRALKEYVDAIRSQLIDANIVSNDTQTFDVYLPESHYSYSVQEVET